MDPREVGVNIGKIFPASEGPLGLKDLQTKDPIVPEHYLRFPIEPIRFAEENGLTPLQGKIIKYVCRFDGKGGLTDLYKARRCLDMLIKKEEGDPDWWARPSKPEPAP